MRGKLNEAYAHINKKCNIIKRNTISDLINQINQIENAYQHFASANNDILNLLNLMLDHYSRDKNNFYIERNVKSVSNVQIYEKESTLNLIDYFNNYTLINDDKVITINKYKFTKIKNINFHLCEASCVILLSDGRIASSSFDRTIKIYNIKDYHCDISIEEHKDAVISIAQLDNGKLVSCSDDKTIRIWTISNLSYQCVCAFNSKCNSKELYSHNRFVKW